MMLSLFHMLDSLRNGNFADFAKTHCRLRTFVIIAFLLLCVNPLSMQAQPSSEKELRKVAEEYFETGKYRDALPLYSQLVSNYPKDPNYNYRYGACLTFGGEDKSKGLEYLKYSVTRPDVEPQSYFFLGKAYHLNYDFKRAVNNYKKFISLSKPKEQSQYEVQGHLKQAESGQSLLRNITDIVVLEKKKLQEADFFKVYDLEEFGGKMVLKPEEFRSEYEKKEGIESVMYLPKDASTIYFTSIKGEEGSGSDLYTAERNDKGWSSPKAIASLNTDLDEGFPFMHPDGNTLYFSSKGHNSLGGYDVFKSEYNTTTGKFEKPVNMDFAINTPDDDFLFISDADQKTAYFSSKRSSKQGEVHVYKINMERVALDVAIITGIFESKSTKKAKIDVKDVERGVQIGSWETDGTSGKYLIELPQTGKFQFLVDYEGSQVTHSGIVELKNQDPFSPLFQEMKIENQGTVDEKLIIKNMIDIEISDDDPVIADIFKKRAQLDVTPQDKVDRAQKAEPVLASNTSDRPKLEIVNEGKKPVGGAEAADNAEALAEASAGTTTKNSGSTENGATDSESSEIGAKSSSTGSVPPGSISPTGRLKFELTSLPATKDEIIEVSFNNAKSLEKDAQILELESEVAKNIAKNKRRESGYKSKEAANLLASIDTNITSPTNLKTQDRVKRLDRQSELLLDEARTAEQLAEKLNDRAYQKRSGVAIATSYANQIQNSIDENNTESSLAKLKELQNYVEEQKQEKSSIDYSEEDVEEKLKAKQTTYKNQRQYADRLKDEVFAKEKTLLTAKAGSKNAETLSKEIESDREAARQADARAKSTGREVETLARELAVITEIIDNVQSSQPIRALASETPDATILPKVVDVEDVLTAVAEDETLESYEEVADEAATPEFTEDGLHIVEQNSVSSHSASEVRAEGSVGREHNYAHTDFEAPSGSRFNTDHLMEQLTSPEDQSLIKIMRSGYHNAYQNDFMHVAEERDEVKRAMKMKVLNEDWLADMDRERKYLDSVETVDDSPELYATIEERKSNLYKLHQIKERELEKNVSQLDRLAAEGSVDLVALEQEVKESYTPDPVPYVVNATASPDEQNAAELASQTRNQNQAAPGNSSTANGQGTSESAGNNAQTEGAKGTGGSGSDNQNEAFENGESASRFDDTGIESGSTQSSLTRSNSEAGATANSQQNNKASSSNQSSGSSSQEIETLDAPDVASITELEAGRSSSAGPITGASGTRPSGAANSIFNEESKFEAESPAGQLIPEAQSKTQIQGVSRDVRNTLQNNQGSAQSELESLETELGNLNTELATTKKKKKRRVLEAQIVDVESQVNNQRKIVDAYVTQIEALDELTTVDANSFNKSGSTAAELSPADMASMQAQELEQMAKDTLQYAEDLKALAENTKKKKEKKRLIAKAEVLTEKAERMTKQAEVSNIEAEELRVVEANVVDVRNKVRLEIPEVSEVVSTNDAQEIANSPAYKRFDNRVALGERKIQQAQVLYEDVKKAEAEAVMMETELQEMENLANEQEDPAQKEALMTKVESLRERAAEKREIADRKFKEAEVLAIEGNKERNAAIAEVLKLNEVERQGILALVTQQKTGTVALPSQQGFSKDDFSKIVQGQMEIPGVLTSAIYKKIDFNESLYGPDNPIPVNSSLPEGVCYAVQVGAFLRPISQDVFRGFAPVRGEDGPNGFTRYSAGIFKKINEANLAKNEIRAIGYKDAFVVAYRDGNRIPVFEAKKILEGEAQGQASEVASAAASSTEGTSSTNSNGASEELPENARLYSGEDVKGLYYTVQVGAYSREVPPSAMFNLSPLVSHQTGGLVKYTSGIYQDIAPASAAKTRIRDLGISDAFVTIYYGGNRVSQAEADQLVAEQGPSVFAKEEGLQNRVPSKSNTPQVSPPASKPAPSANAGGIEFVVQVGAYESEVPFEDAQIILGISNLGLDVVIEGNMTKYIVGGYTSYQEANDFKEKIIAEGLKGAFILAMQNGKQVDLQRAIQLSGN